MELHDIDNPLLWVYNILIESWNSTRKGCGMVIAFSGHSVILANKNIKEMIKEQIRNNIVDVKSVTCYLGGYGDFDNISARACRELKEENTNIELVYVTPYMSVSEQEKIKEMQRNGIYDNRYIRLLRMCLRDLQFQREMNG